MADFKFQLGQQVVTKAGMWEADLHAANGEAGIALVFTIVGRIADECTAGVQLNYRIAKSGEVGLVHEDELAPCNAELLEAQKKRGQAARANRYSAFKEQFPTVAPEE